MTGPRASGMHAPGRSSRCSRPRARGSLPPCYSPDGTRIVTASADKTARASGMHDGRSASSCSQAMRMALASAVFSPDGTRIVTASAGQNRADLGCALGQPIVVLSGHGGNLSHAVYSPDGTRIVTASADKTARIWDARTGQPIAVLAGHAIVGAPPIRPTAPASSPRHGPHRPHLGRAAIPKGNIFAVGCAPGSSNPQPLPASPRAPVSPISDPICDGDPPLPVRCRRRTKRQLSETGTAVSLSAAPCPSRNDRFGSF